jgi:hypothetical protein
MKRFLPLALAGGLLLGAVAPVAAAPNARAIQTALVGVLAQVQVELEDVLNNATVEVITVDINDSLNNLLRNADIDINVLNDSLNNVLRNVDINIEDITVVGDDLVITLNVLGDTLILT